MGGGGGEAQRIPGRVDRDEVRRKRLLALEGKTKTTITKRPRQEVTKILDSSNDDDDD